MARQAISMLDRFKILRRDHFTCMYCGNRPPAVRLHVDHVLAVSRGGTNDPRNLLTACTDCNLGKSDLEVYQGRPEQYRYEPRAKCSCPRPFCGGPFRNPKDDSERTCSCSGCHSCDVCGFDSCDRAGYDMPDKYDAFTGCASVGYVYQYVREFFDGGADPWLTPHTARDVYFRHIRLDLQPQVKAWLDEHLAHLKEARDERAAADVAAEDEGSN